MVKWLNGGRLLIVFIVIMFIYPKNSNALSEGKQSFLNFSSFSVIADSIVNIGDTIKLRLNVISLQEDSATVYLHASKGLHILNNDSTFYQLRINTDTNSIQNIEIRLIIDSIQNCFFELVTVSDFNNGLNENIISNRGEFLINGGNQLVFNSQYDNEDATISTIQYSEPTCIIQNNHHIKVKGKVTFLDWNEPKSFYASGNTLAAYPRRKSPKTTAWIFFRTTNYPNQFSHPLKFDQATNKPIKGIHYVECVEGANFNESTGEFLFEFDYNPLSLYCQSNENMTVEIYLAKENEATKLNCGNDNIKVTNLPNPFNNDNELKLYPTKYFSITYTNGVPQNIDISYITKPELNIELPWDEGSIFRYMTISREFIKDTYNNTSLEFSDNRKVEQCNTNLLWEASGTSNPGACYWLGTKNIDIYKYYNGKDDNYSNCKVIAHEYGHYFDYTLTSFGHNENEGFALFFSYAANVWMKNSFGDLFGIDDDCEIGPFCTYYKDDAIFTKGGISYNRFGNITKLGVPDVNSCRFACYLWNIYDSKSDQPFSPISDWDGMANDDVEDLRQDLMNFWIEKPLSGNSFSTFNTSFVNKYSANKKLQNSIQAIFDFMDFPSNSSNPSLENVTPRMKSPNIQNMNYSTNLINNQVFVKFSWGSDISYINIPFEWEYNNYKFVYPFSNTPQSIKLFHNYTDLDVWDLVETYTDYSSVHESDWYLTNNQITYDNFQLATINDVDSLSYYPLKVNMGIPLGKQSVYFDESEKSSIIPNVYFEGQSLYIISENNAIITNASIYNIEGKLIENLIFNNEYAKNHCLFTNIISHQYSFHYLFLRLSLKDEYNKIFQHNYKIFK